MQLNFSIKSFFLHSILFAGILYAPVFLPMPFIMIALIYFYLSKKNVEVLIVGVYAVTCKSEMMFYAYNLTLICLFLIDKRTIIFSKDRKKLTTYILVFIFYLVLIYLLQLADNSCHSLLSLPLYAVTFLSFFVLPFVVWKLNLSKDNVQYLFNHILLIAICQFIIALFFQAIPIGIGTILARPTIGDWVMGTTNNSTYIAIVLILSILPFFFSLKNNVGKNKIIIILLFFLFLGLCVLNDSKLIIYAAVLATGPFIYTRSSALLKYILVSILFLVIISGTLIRKLSSSIQDNYYDYIIGRYNSKVVYFERAFSFKTRDSYQYFFGTGGGTNGSRAANALAYNTLPKKGVTLPSFIPPHTNTFTKKYIAPLYTAEDAETVGNRSVVLGNPFNSICAMFVELGVIGFAIFLSFFVFIIKYSLKRKSITSNVLIISVFILWITSFLFPSMENGAFLFFIFLTVGIIFNNNLNDLYKK